MKRPLDYYLSSKPNGSYEKIADEIKNEKCWIKKIELINLKLNKEKDKRDSLIEELIILIKSNSSKHKQFLKEQEIKATESYISDCFIIKRKILLKTINNEDCN